MSSAKDQIQAIRNGVPAALATPCASDNEVLAQLLQMTNAYAKAVQDAGLTPYPESLAIVWESRAIIAKARKANTTN